MEHHQQHFHLSQLGSGVKRTLNQETREVKRTRQDFAKKIDEKGIPEPDREDSMLEGNRVNAYFYLKTKAQKVNQKVFFKESMPRLEARLKDALKEKKAIKWSLVYHCDMSMPDKYRSKPMLYSPHFRLEHPITSTYPEQLQEQIDASMEVFQERMSIFVQARSCWTLHQNHALILEMDTYEPLQGSSYIELPKDILHTKAVVNIKNEDLECFKWCILAALHPASNHAEGLTNYQDYKEDLNFDGIEFPVPIHQMSKFEKQNPGISITVIGITNDKEEKKNRA